MVGKRNKILPLALAFGLVAPVVAPNVAPVNVLAAAKTPTVDAIKFNGMTAPNTIENMVKPYSEASVTVRYSDGTTKDFPLSYNQLFASGDKIVDKNGMTFSAGTPLDVKGNPIKDPSAKNDTYFVSDSPDANTLIKANNGKLYMISHYEYDSVDSAGNNAYGLVPASMSLSEVEQDPSTGELKVVNVDKIDFSTVDGLWIPCNGSLSPWGTHLGSEEYEPNARDWADGNVNSNAYLQLTSFAKLFYKGDVSKANPYNYGFIPEVTINNDGSTTVVKHYNVGRFSHEIMRMMPDQKTAYFGDDGTDVGLFMYVADKEADLSAGTLYAAKFHQTSPTGEAAGSGDLEWIKLGHATDDEVKQIINSGTTFNDIFETADAPAEGFKAVKTDANSKVEYLKLKPGKEKAAAYLESRRYAAYLGASTEFRKMEGVAVNAADKKAYIAMSEISKGMTDREGDVQFKEQKAGGVFELDLQPNQKDSENADITSSYVAKSMNSLILGDYKGTADAFGNTADPNKIASPDNLDYSETMKTLFIGEDSGYHTNNYVWSYNLETKELSRILSVPAGAEATGLSAVDNRNNFSYITGNFQHAGEFEPSKVTAVNGADLLDKIAKSPYGIHQSGAVGYINGLPKVDSEIVSYRFISMDSPSTIEQMAKPYSDAKVEVKYKDGSTKQFDLDYKELFASGDKIVEKNGAKFSAGTPLNVDGEPIVDPSAAASPDTYFVSDAPDANTLLKPIGDKLYLISHYEYDTFDSAGNSAYGLVPASMSLAEVKQNEEGKLEVVNVKKIDFSSVDGLWIPCNGSLSPWNTHLGSEEYEPNARDWVEGNVDSTTYPELLSFAKLYYNGDISKANPYNYGWIPEVTVGTDGNASVQKHYSAGRFSHEIMRIMPDQKTAYFGDDGSDVGLFMYVADKKADLSAGTLYAAKFKQTGTDNGGSGDLTWIELGHATDAEVKAIIDQGTTFNDIFETSAEAKEGFTAVKTDASSKVEYLKVKPGMEKAAAFMESRRYAAYLGASTEFRKMEGVDVNAADKKVYIAISEVGKGMSDGKGDIQLNEQKAGTVFELPLKGNVMDFNGKAINSEYVAGSMKGLVVGEYTGKADELGNTANPAKIASPDNLSYSEALQTLFIGEDSGYHTNNFVWAYNVKTGDLQRVLSVPAGAEATGLQAVDDRNGYRYLMSNFQHSGDYDFSKVTKVNQSDLLKAIAESPYGIAQSGAIGYISGLPLVEVTSGAPTNPDGTPGDGPQVGNDQANHIEVKLDSNKKEMTVTLDQNAAKLSKNGILTIAPDHAVDQNKLTVSVPVETLAALVKENGSLFIDKGDSSMSIPKAILEQLIKAAGNKPVEFIFTKKYVEAAIGPVYEYTILANGKAITTFNGEQITLTFDVNSSNVKNPDHVKVYYYNEDSKKWEEVNSSYDKDKKLAMAATKHFSTFGVFESESNQAVNAAKPVAVDKNGNPLPDTATNSGNWILTGFLILAAGITTFFARRKHRNRSLNN